jgi:acetyltransferase-like isoleucine patch superfamily enzyme
MSYGIESTGRKNGVLKRICIRCGKTLAGSFPLNRVRIWGLKLCGFNVGLNVYVGPGLMIASLISETGCELDIGDRVSIGPGVTFVLSSDANWSKLNKVFSPVRGKIRLENDCWLGAGVIVLPDITIGECSVAGAGCVVTGNIPPYKIYAGVPAKEIGNIEREKL